MRSLCCLFLFLSAVPRPVSAQTDTGTAAVTGTVADATGKGLANAAVTIKSGPLSRTANTDLDGRFSIASLPPGEYNLEVAAAGFAPATRSGLRLAAGATQDLNIPLSLANVSQSVDVEASVLVATRLAPMQNSLDARSAQTVIGTTFIDNFASPVADFTELVQMAPGTFSVNPNGVGLGDSKTYFRGFADGQYTMTFDGIPFNDTNSPTHHSWAFFPSQWIGETVFDRSPGSAATIGPTNFGGSIHLLSRDVQPEPDIRASVSYGSFDTVLLDLSLDTGRFFKDKKSEILIDLHQLKSNGYQTYNYQKRDAGSLKYNYHLNDKTTISVFGGLLDLFTNTPNTKGPTRAQVALFGDNYLLSGDPKNAAYYGFNYYHVASDFEYIGLQTELGHGWKLDTKAYTYRYWNKQNYNGTTISATSATDKLNGYRKIGDTLALSQESRWGVFRTGVWYEWAYTDRYQYPTSPLTGVNAVFPNFHEHFITQSVQPYAEYEWRAARRLRITAGLKSAYYRQGLNQFADGKTVGNLNGARFVTHRVNYNSWLPSVDANYRLKDSWSVYAQYSTGSVIPPSSVFDVKNGLVSTLPKPTLARIYQGGTVWKRNRFNLDFDVYHVHFENAYASTPDATGEPIYFKTSDSTSTGVEAEGTVVVSHGFSVYANATAGQAKYVDTHLWVQNAPRDTETVGLTYQLKFWDLGFFNKRIGRMYNDNGAVNQAVRIDPFNLTNVFLNYTLRDRSHFRGTKIRLSVNNLFDQHNIVGVTPAATTTSIAAPGDVLTLLPARSVVVSITGGWAPRR